MTTTEEDVAPVPSDGPADVPVPAYSHRQIMLIMSGLGVGLLLASLDQTIVSTALTRISEDFHRLDLYSWVVTSYLLTSTVTTPLYGKISDLFGRKRIFQASIVLFLIGSILSGLSQNMYQLILFRGVQGLGAGGLMSLAMAIVGDVIPPRQRGRYQGYFGAVFGTASVLGPLVGGFLVDQASWRWVFYVNLPIGVVALVVINRVLQLDHQPRRIEDRRGRFGLDRRRRVARPDRCPARRVGGPPDHHVAGPTSSRGDSAGRLRLVGAPGGRADHPDAPVPQPGVLGVQRPRVHHRVGDVRGPAVPAPLSADGAQRVADRRRACACCRCWPGCC